MEINQSDNETTRLARHEAAHFVISWTTGGNPKPIDITAAARRQSINPNKERVAYCGADDDYNGYGWNDVFKYVIRTLAGPVADNWGRDYDEMLASEKADIDDAFDSLAGDYEDEGDWYETFDTLGKYVVGTKDPTKLKNTLPPFIEAVQEVLTICDTQWQELTEYLIEHGRIDLNQPYWEGDNDWRFISNWDDEDGLPPIAVRNCVEKYRLALAPKVSVETTYRTIEDGDS